MIPKKNRFERVVAICQLNFLPWLGYFDLIDRSNIFVLLDDVEFSKQSWQQRNRIKTTNGNHWLTVPVIYRGHSGQEIKSVRIKENSNYKKKHINTIKQYYSKSTYFNMYINELSLIINKPHQYLVELNIDLINWLCLKIGINTRLIKSSQMSIDISERVEKLVNICKELGADHYLSPAGSKEYIEENNIFSKHGIKLLYQDYKHPTYNQMYGDFIPFMSVIDLLFNEGDKSLEIIKSGSFYS